MAVADRRRGRGRFKTPCRFQCHQWPPIPHRLAPNTAARHRRRRTGAQDAHIRRLSSSRFAETGTHSHRRMPWTRIGVFRRSALSERKIVGSRYWGAPDRRCGGPLVSRTAPTDYACAALTKHELEPDTARRQRIGQCSVGPVRADQDWAPVCAHPASIDRLSRATTGRGERSR